MSTPYLRPGLPAPVPSDLDRPYWEGLREERLLIQRCKRCARFQWGPEWICHRCLNVDLGWTEVEPRGFIYSHQRVWHPVHPALRGQGPYVIVLVTIAHADDVRVVGNLLGDPLQELVVGAEVQGVFEHHTEADTGYSLLQWRYAT